MGCALFISCNVRQVDEPVQSSTLPAAQNSSLFNSVGVEKTVFYPYETVILSLGDLWPQWETAIEVVRLADKKILRRLVVFTDSDGKIAKIPVWYCIGVAANGFPIDEEGDYTIRIQQASKDKPWLIVAKNFKVNSSMSGIPAVWVSKSDGSYGFSTAPLGSAVYATGAGFVPGSQVKLHVVLDKDAYNTGDVLADQTGSVEQVTVKTDGTLPNTVVWASALAGNYDVVADVAPFGEFGAGDAVSDGQLVGLVVQTTPVAADIITEVACNSSGIHQNTFTCLDAIWAKAEPGQKPKNASELAALYVVVHKDTWKAGDGLIDVETVSATEMPIQCLVNPLSGSLALTPLRGQGKTSDGQPIRLWPGSYDVVVDIGRNGKYDPGTDILDGGPQVGFTITCDEMAQSYKLIVAADCDFLDLNTNETNICALVIDKTGKPVQGASITFKTEEGYCAIASATGITDANGMFCTKLYNITTWGGWLLIKTTAVVNGETFTERSSIWKEVPYTHNTGVIVGN